MGVNGTNLLLLANTGTAGSPAYEAVGSQRDATIEESDAGIDVSSKDQREQRVLPGRYSSTITLDHLYVPSDAAYQALQSALRDGNLILMAREEGGAVAETATVRVDSLSESHPDQAEAVVSASFTVDGAWTAVGS